jgi:hypothetical protein
MGGGGRFVDERETDGCALRARKEVAMRFHLPSPSTAIAATALFVALGGTGYAASHAGAGGAPQRAAATKRVACPLKASMCSAIDRQIAAYVGSHTSALRGRAGSTGGRGATGPAGAVGAAGAAGAPGESYVPGPAGATGATGAQAVSAFSGRIGAFPSTSHVVFTQYGAPSGVSAANGSEDGVQTLSPSTPVTLSDFDALEDGLAVPAGDIVRAYIDVDGAEALACVIGAGQSSCGSGSSSVVVPAGSSLSIRIDADATNGGTISGFDLLFGFQATT